MHTADAGGYGSINHLIKLGIVEIDELGQNDNPWEWINKAASSSSKEFGLEGFDSGTSIGEQLLLAAAKSPEQIGQQRTQTFRVTPSKSDSLKVNLNNEAHYGLVQSFMLDTIWTSTWLTRKGADIVWTFAVHRGEEQDRTPILGPKLVGKALTAAIPKWFKYTFRIASIPVEGTEPTHRLYLQEYPELSGLGHGFGNSRFAMGGGELPPFIEPASIVKALEMIEEGEQRALEAAKTELGL